jgi:hypothetical protein
MKKRMVRQRASTLWLRLCHVRILEHLNRRRDGIQLNPDTRELAFFRLLCLEHWTSRQVASTG